jgi:hypothetical protein
MKVPRDAVLTMHGDRVEWVDACQVCGASAVSTSQWCAGWPTRGFSGGAWLVTVSCPGCGHDGQYLTGAAGVRRGNDDA